MLRGILKLRAYGVPFCEFFAQVLADALDHDLSAGFRVGATFKKHAQNGLAPYGSRAGAAHALLRIPRKMELRWQPSVFLR